MILNCLPPPPEDEQTRIISMKNTINMQEVELKLCRTEIGKLQRKVIDLEEENMSLKNGIKGLSQ